MYLDTHIDVIYHMTKEKRVFAPKTDKGHIDLEKAEKGDLLAGFFAIFPNDNYYYTEEMAKKWISTINNPINHLEKIDYISKLDNLIDRRSTNSSTNSFSVGAIMHIEGAAGIDTSLNKLYLFYEAGLRSLGITWNEQNQFATGVLGDENRGFTKEGLDLLSAMEDLGIIIDVSHLNDKSFWQVIDNTNKPLIASHSNLRKRADHKRNLTDDMVKAIADTNGCIGINFCSGFLSTNENHPPNRHCAHEMIRDIIELTGSYEHVNIGSDFDGCTTPKDIPNITIMPQFFSELQERLSLSQDDLIKIKYGNICRVIKSIWKH